MSIFSLLFIFEMRISHFAGEGTSLSFSVILLVYLVFLPCHLSQVLSLSLFSFGSRKKEVREVMNLLSIISFFCTTLNAIFDLELLNLLL